MFDIHSSESIRYHGTDVPLFNILYMSNKGALSAKRSLFITSVKIAIWLRSSGHYFLKLNHHLVSSDLYLASYRSGYRCVRHA